MPHPWEEWISGKKQGIAPALLRTGLWLSSKPYSAVISFRNWCYDRGWKKVGKVPIPVISIGNLTVGGTGKTPAVTMIAKYYREKDVRVAVVSRGYAAGEDGRNDEAMELELRLPDVPHLQNADRIAASNMAYEELDSQLILLDDAFQHRRIHRDLDIVLLDALEPFGYDHLLPRGLLREPVRSLRRAQVVLVTRADQVEAQKLADMRTLVQRYAPLAAWVETRHQPIGLRSSAGTFVPLDYLHGRKVFAFCGLGNPQGFLTTLQSLSQQPEYAFDLLDSQMYPDHHPYSRHDIEFIQSKAGQADTLLCTGKDLPKIGVEKIGNQEVWALEVELQIIAGWEPLRDRLDKFLPESQDPILS